jgi:hypothetical protein
MTRRCLDNRAMLPNQSLRSRETVPALADGRDQRQSCSQISLPSFCRCGGRFIKKSPVPYFWLSVTASLAVLCLMMGLEGIPPVACQPTKMEAALLLLSRIPSERVDRYLSLCGKETHRTRNSKTVAWMTVPWVRIPPSPPVLLSSHWFSDNFHQYARMRIRSCPRGQRSHGGPKESVRAPGSVSCLRRLRGAIRILISRQPNADLDAPPSVRYWG